MRKLCRVLLPLFLVAMLALATEGVVAAKPKEPILPTAADELKPAKGKVVDGIIPHDKLPKEILELGKDHKPPKKPGPGKPPIATAYPDHTWIGFYYGSTVTGLRYDQSALLSFDFTPTSPGKDITMFPVAARPYHSCLEAGLLHWMYSYSSVTGKVFFTFDWCGPGAGGDGTGSWQNNYDTTNATWRSKYTHVATWTSMTQSGVNYDDKTIHPRTWQYSTSPNCWETDLWNYSTGSYDVAATSCGTDTAPIADGWSIYEINAGWGTTPYPACAALGFYNRAQYRDAYRLYSGTWATISAWEVSSVASAPTGGNPCLGGTYNYDWYDVVNKPGATYTGGDWAVCGPTASRTSSNPVCG